MSSRRQVYTRKNVLNNKKLTTSQERENESIEQTPGFRKGTDLKFSSYIIEKYLNNTPLGVIETDQDQKVIRWSFEAERIFGWNSQEILGRKFDEIPVHCDNDPLTLNDKTIFQGENKSGVNVRRNYTKSGRMIDCVWYNSATTDSDGNIASVLLLVDDVTKQKQAERILMANEEKYRLLFDRMSEGFAMLEIIYDKEEKPADFILISANPSFEKLTAIKLLKNIGKGLTEFIPPEEKYWIDICHKTALSGKTVDYENFSPTLDKYFRLNIFCPQKGYIAAIVENITERKRAEKELHESKKKLELALESAHIGIWEWDMTTNVMNWDRRMETIFGYRNGKINKNLMSFENYIHEEDISHFRNSINLSLKNNLPLETAFRSRPYKGESKYIVTKAIVLTDKHGRTTGFTGVCYDMTGMQRGTEDIMVKLNDELLRSNLELEQFAYVASHDLQEPLRMISSFTQLLAQKYGDKLDNDAREYIRFAVDGSKRMYELINGLLAYSRVQTKGKEFLPVNMNSVIQQVLRNLKLYIKETNSKIICPDIHWVLADEAQMIQLIQNLVTNAIKFSHSTPKVSISSKRMKDYIKFAVRDEGIGIEQQYFEKIFKIFQRLDPSRHKGTGIGLAVCKRIVERHGGRIWVTSNPGKGSTFHFTIPATSIQITEPNIPFT
jgi:PAS domain S-box-containing protein